MPRAPSRPRGPSKLARALGDRVPVREKWELPKKPTTADLFRAYAIEQVHAIHKRDPDVRRDLPDAIHKMRVATRRLRSALATYRPVVDREAGDQLRAELKWLAGELGGARDAEVQREHFPTAVAEQPVELVMGRVAGFHRRPSARRSTRPAGCRRWPRWRASGTSGCWTRSTS